MVRKALRLPPTTKSVEEILLERMAGGSSSSASSARCSTLKRASRTATTAPPPRRADGSDAIAARAATSEATASSSLEALTAMASDISSLDARLEALAAAPAAAPAPARASASTGALASPYQSAIEQFVQASIQSLQPPVGARASAAASGGGSSGAHVSHGVRELRSTVRRLGRVFLEVATGDSQRQQAATAICTLARGFLARRRFAKLRHALGSWRARACAGWLAHVELFSAREEFRRTRMAQMHAARQAAWLGRVLAELRDVVLLRLPLRAHQREESDRRFRDKQLARLRRVLSPWKAAALGPRSRKQAAGRARERHLAARRRLEATGRFDVVTAEMAHEEFLKANVRAVRAAHAGHVLRLHWRLLLDALMRPLRRHQARALAHARRALLSRAWRAWLPVFRAQQVDKAIADAAADGGGDDSGGRPRRPQATLERFDKPVNLRRVDAHRRHAVLRRHLRAWRRLRALLRRVRALFEGSTKSALGERLRRWHARARYQRALRANAVESWRGYCRRVSQTPFRAWYVLAAKRRARRAAQERICAAYARRARRQAKYSFFRLWKHQALFGSVEGAHSRLALLRALEDQKRLSLSLERNAALYRDNIGALQASVEQLEDKLLEKQQELARAHADAQAARFGLHAAEQAVARAHGLLEALRVAHPGTVARLERALAENPLLTADLAQVLARHAATRQQLLMRIARDEAASQVVDAAPGAALGSDDQLLLHRVKWVLSRLDLRPAQGTERLHEGSAGDVQQLCALLEFVRDGDTRALAPANDPERDRHALRDWTSTPVHVDSINRLDGDGGGAGETAKRVRREDLEASAEPWAAFVRALALQFAPDKMRAVRERLVARAAEADDELQALKANPHIYNLYSGSALPK